MRRFLLIFILIGVFSCVSAQGTHITNKEELMSKLRGLSVTLQSIESDFEQIKRLDIFDTDIRSNGRFYYKKENKISLDYKKPIAYLIIINENKIKTVTDGKSSVMNLTDNKIMNQMRSLLTACMTGDFSNTMNEYKFDFSENNTHYVLKVNPVNEMIKAYITSFTISLNKTDFSVDSLRITENETDYTDYIFTNKKFNSLKDDSKFKID